MRGFRSQILSNLKSKLETIAQTFNDFYYLVDLAHDTLYQRETTAKDIGELQRRTRSPSRTRSKSIGKQIRSCSTLHCHLTSLTDEERVLFETRQSPIKGLRLHASAVSLSLGRSHVVSQRSFLPSFFVIWSLSRLERTSKRSRILDFFRGRGRPAERAETNGDPSHVSFIDKTSMK